MKTENISSFKKFHNLYILLPEVHGRYTPVKMKIQSQGSTANSLYKPNIYYTFSVLFFWDWSVDINKIFADMYHVFFQYWLPLCCRPQCPVIQTQVMYQQENNDALWTVGRCEDEQPLWCNIHLVGPTTSSDFICHCLWWVYWLIII